MWAMATADRSGLLNWSPSSEVLARPRLSFPSLAEHSESLLDRAKLVARADLVLSGRYPLLGIHDGIHWGTSPNWFLDPLAERAAPVTHFSRVPYLDEAVVGDHKVAWELNRHQWLVWLAIAARLTGDPRYSASIWRHLEDWLNKNPRGQGMNWVSSLEVAFRAIAWTWTLHLVPEAPPAHLGDRLGTSLHAHGLHVERWLSTWFSPNTHLTGEALGLLYLGAAFPSLPRARQWRTLGWEVLCQQAFVQMRPDGTYFEQTGWYQAYTVDFYLHALQLAEQAALSVPATVRDRVHAGARALHAMSHSNGHVVRWGDDDGGRLLPLAASSYGDVRDSLTLAAVLLGDASLLPERTSRTDNGLDNVIWMCGDAGIAQLEQLSRQPVARESVVLPSGGWVALRAPRLEVFMDAGEHSQLSGAHAHADALSVEISVDGQVVIADPGTYRYMGPGRDEFRATAAHSCLQVGTHSSADADGPFRWKRTTHASIDAARVSGTVQLCSAHHDGFAHLALEGSGRVTRHLVLFDDNTLLVIDEADGQFSEPIAANWRPPAGLRAEVLGNRVHLRREPSDRVGNASPTDSKGGETLATIVISQDWSAVSSVSAFSPGYAVRTHVVGARVTPAANGTSANTLVCVIVPGEAPARVCVNAGDASSSRVWRVCMPSGEATVWLGDGHHGAVRSNASLTVVLGAVSEPTQVCTVNASALAIGGEPVEVVCIDVFPHAVTLVERRDQTWQIVPA